MSGERESRLSLKTIDQAMDALNRDDPPWICCSSFASRHGAGATSLSKETDMRPEPTFTLKATDPHAPAALDRYADLLESQRAPVGKISAARHVAQKMRGWLAGQEPAVALSDVPVAADVEPAVTDIEPVEVAPANPFTGEGEARPEGTVEPVKEPSTKKGRKGS